MKNYRKQLKELRTLSGLVNPNDLKTIKDLKEGSFFSLKGELFKVTAVSTYTEKDGWKWYELECYNIIQDKKVYIEWEEDDEIKVSITTKELKISDINRTANDIEAIADKEEGSVIANGKTYYYDDDYGATWEKGNEKYKVYFYDFITNNNEMLTVEEWKVAKGQYEYKVYLSKEVYPEDITVISI